jgi:hypothetical protein
VIQQQQIVFTTSTLLTTNSQTMAEALIEILKVRGETALGTPQPSATRPTSKMEKPKAAQTGLRFVVK